MFMMMISGIGTLYVAGTTSFYGRLARANVMLKLENLIPV